MPEKLDKGRLREILQAQKEKALENITSCEETADPVKLDQSRLGRLSRMDALQQQAMSQARLERAKLELIRIDAALHRLDSERYGYCIQCDNKIETERLLVNPNFLKCKKCM